jgi:hypothetical protein
MEINSKHTKLSAKKQECERNCEHPRQAAPRLTLERCEGLGSVTEVCHMNRVMLLIVALIGLSGGLSGQAVFAQVPATQQQPDKQMMERGHHAMGFDQMKTTHHFLLQHTGGAIEITANDKADSASIGSIRTHLEHIRGAFAAGNFSMPMFIHGTEPLGADVLATRRVALVYRVEEIPAGGRLIITTTDTEALAALHAFLKFQITEHKTGDPMVPK